MKNIAPGLIRRGYGFENWNDFDEVLWDKVREEAKKSIKDFKGTIIGRDKNMRNVRLAERNAKNAKVADIIKFERADFFKTKAEIPSTLIFNPPYDERIKLEDDAFYDKISDTLITNFKDCNAWIISSYKEGMSDIELQPLEKISLSNGSLDCEYSHFEIK
jgi:putative N6-adenine-specific DNA methylase